MPKPPDIDKPPSEVEIAEAIDALHATGCQHQAMAIRRMAFQRDALKEAVLKLVRASVRAHAELNAIRARDGVPYRYDGRRSDVQEEYFSSVVDGLDYAVHKATGYSAHCHPELYK